MQCSGCGRIACKCIRNPRQAKNIEVQSAENYSKQCYLDEETTADELMLTAVNETETSACNIWKRVTSANRE